MVKPTVSSSQSPRHEVWQPQGYNGIEIGIKQSTSELYFPKFFLQNYTVVLNANGHGSAHYGSNRYRFTEIADLVFLQQPGNVFTGRFKGEAGTGGACVVIPPARLAELAIDLGLRGSLSFTTMILPDNLNTLIARFAAKSISSFVRPTSRLERESNLLALINAILVNVSSANAPEQKLGSEHKAVSTIKSLIVTAQAEV